MDNADDQADDASGHLPGWDPDPDASDGTPAGGETVADVLGVVDEALRSNPIDETTAEGWTNDELDEWFHADPDDGGLGGNAAFYELVRAGGQKLTDARGARVLHKARMTGINPFGNAPRWGSLSVEEKAEVRKAVEEIGVGGVIAEIRRLESRRPTFLRIVTAVVVVGAVVGLVYGLVIYDGGSDDGGSDPEPPAEGHLADVEAPDADASSTGDATEDPAAAPQPESVSVLLGAGIDGTPAIQLLGAPLFDPTTGRYLVDLVLTAEDGGQILVEGEFVDAGSYIATASDAGGNPIPGVSATGEFYELGIYLEIPGYSSPLSSVAAEVRIGSGDAEVVLFGDSGETDDTD